jgi:hypothetical protein
LKHLKKKSAIMLYRSPDPLPFVFSRPSVFMAGGICNCTDWQSQLAPVFDTGLYDVVNPRKLAGYDHNRVTARAQIEWEHKALSNVDSCVFWFPEENVSAVTLLELGKMLSRASHHSVRLAVGWHPNYQLAYDLEAQIHLETDAGDYVIHAAPGWDKLVNVVKKTWG